MGLRGDWHSPSGLGEAARSTHAALTAAGVRTLAVPVRKDRIQAPALWSGPLAQPDADADVWIHQLPPDYFDLDRPGKHVAVFPWEADRLPSRPVQGVNWTDALNRLNEVWAPSGFVRDVLKASGVRADIQVIPHPIDTDLYCPDPKRPLGHELSPHFDPDSTVFLYTGTWDARKRPDILVRCFCKAFTAADPALLVIKSYVNGLPHQDAQVLARRLHACRTGDAQVRLVPQVLSSRKMANLYRLATVFVTATRGEGFCLPAVEAMSCAKPVIAIGWSAFTEYPAVPLDYRLAPVQPDDWMDGYEPDRQRWAQVNEDDLIDKLRWAHRQRDELTRLGEQARAWVLGHASMAVVGEATKRRVERLAGSRP